MNQTFSIQEALRTGYRLTKEHFVSLLGIMLLLFVLQAIVAISVEERKLLQLFAQIFVMPGFALATVSVFFRVSDGQKPEFAHLSERFHHYLNFVATSALYVFAIFAGILFLVLPGIYLSIRLMFAQTLVAEKNLQPMEAFRISGVLTKGLIWKLLTFNIVVGLVNVCGLLLLGVGLLFTIPMTGIATLIVYKKLSQERLDAQKAVDIPVPTPQ